MFRAPLPRSPLVLSTPRLSRGRVSAGSHHWSAKSSRPPGCLGPSSAGGCAPKAPGGRGPSPLSMLPGHSHPSSSRDAAPSTQLWTRMDPSLRPGPPSARSWGAGRVGHREGAPLGGTLLLDARQCLAPGRYQDLGPRHVHQAGHRVTGGPQGAHGLPGRGRGDGRGLGTSPGVSHEPGGRCADRSRSCPQVRAWEGGDRDRCRLPPGPRGKLWETHRGCGQAS